MADYAISNVPRRVVYANSGVGPYAFTFEILSQTDISVYRGSTLLTLTTDYSVTINANGTGSVTLVTAGTGNVTIVGAKNIQRTSDFTTGGDLFANTLNDELDNQTIFVQQVAETAERGLKAPVTDPTDIAMTLPAKATRAGTVLAFNATTGNPETGPSIASVTTVAAQSANINTVATNISSVNTVAGNSSNINTVSSNTSNVNTVATNIAAINTNATNIVDIQNASTNATNAAASAVSAGNAQTAAEAARDATLTAYDNFDDRYLGSKTSDPSVDNDGNALVAGSLYFNSVSGAMKVYTGSAWVAAYVSGTGFLSSANNLSDVASTTTARTNLGLAIGIDVLAPNGSGASLTSLNANNISSGTLGVARGGTGSATLTANNVLLGNGTSALQAVAPGTAGNVLTSNGTTWTSSTPASGFSGSTTNAVGSSAITLTNTSDQYQVVQINSAANSIVNLPNATTLIEGSNPFVIENRSPIGASLAIKDNAGNTVGYIAVSQIALVSLKDNSSAAGTWAITLDTPQTLVNWDSASIATNALTGANFLGMTGLSSTLFVRHSYSVTGVNSTTITYTFYNQACTISGSTITFGATSNFTQAFSNTQMAEQLVKFQSIRLSNTAFVIKLGLSVFDYSSGSTYYTIQNIRTNTVSGTTITYGTSSNAGFPQISGVANVQNSSLAATNNGTVARLSDTSFAIVYNDAVVNTYTQPYNFSGSLSCQIVTVSGTTQTIGTKVTLATSTYTNPTSIVATSSTRLFVAYGQAASAGSTTGRSKMNVISVSGTVPTWGTSVNIEAADVSGYLTNWGILDGAVAPSATQVVFNIGYGIAEGTVSGTTPTYDSLPSGSVRYPLYLTTSTKAFSPSNANYLSIVTGGFVITNGATNVIQPTFPTNLQISNPLGAQPTTSFIGYNVSDPSTSILGSTT